MRTSKTSFTHPKIGEVKRDKYHNKLIWAACVDCGKERWVRFIKGDLGSLRCNSCAGKLKPHPCGETSANWKDGRKRDQKGYIHVKLQPNDFFYPMATKDGYIPEHRLVMAKKLGRCLQRWEHVHHKGIRYADIRNKSDNLEDNLELTTRGGHAIEHSKGYRDGYAKGLIDGRDKHTAILEQRVTLLEAENVALKQQLESAIEDTQLNIGDWHKTFIRRLNHE